MCANHHHLYSNRCERVGALRQGRAYVSCQIPRRSDLIGSDLHGGTTRFACDRRYPLYPTPPYYIYYTSGIWHRGAGRRTARIGTSSVPTNRDGVRYCAELDLYAIRCGPGRRACLRIGTACVLRIGTTSDTVRARTASERSGLRSICGAATIGACERCGSELCASVTERALRALLDEFTASARPAATRTSTANLCSSRCSRRSVQGHDRRPLRLGIVSSFVMKPIGEPTAQGSARSTV